MPVQPVPYHKHFLDGSLTGAQFRRSAVALHAALKNDSGEYRREFLLTGAGSLLLHNVILDHDAPADIVEKPCTECVAFLTTVSSKRKQGTGRSGRLRRCQLCDLLCTHLPQGRTAYEVACSGASETFSIYRNRYHWPIATYCLATEFAIPLCLERVSDAWEAEHALTIDDTRSNPNQRYGLCSRPDSWAAVSRIIYWLNCCLQHKACRQNHSTKLPTRVIDVGSLGGTQPPHLHFSDGEKAEYLTLSYCWGKLRSICLTRENLGDYSTELPEAAMPQTFLDAIKIARCVGVRYLWIDSLCIIQNDPDDFAKESIRMYEIYRGSIFTISATGFENPTAGMSNARDLDGKQMAYGKAPDGVVKYVSLVESVAVRKQLADGHTSRRGWCLQERLAAPAVLHFLKDKMIWECSTRLESEDGRYEQTDVFLKALSLDGIQTHRGVSGKERYASSSSVTLWYDLVQEYTKRGLSNSSDRMVAIAGLASEFCTLNPLMGRYIAGVWATDFPVGLLWMVARPYSQRELPLEVLNSLEHLPTWSWLRFVALVRYLHPSDYVRIFTRYDTDIKAVIHRHDNDLGEFGSITPGARLLATGYIQQAVLINDRVSINGTDLNIGYLAHIDQSRPHARLCYLIIVCTFGPNRAVIIEAPVTTYYLLLELVPGSGVHGRLKRFRRLGIAYTQWDKSQLEDDDSSRGPWKYSWRRTFPALFQADFQLI